MIYADYNGSSTLHPEVKDYLIKRIENGPFANPNTIHRLGVKVGSALEKCRSICAEALGANPEQVVFHSGASEGISAVFFHVLEEKKDRNIIIISAIEHSAVLNSAKYYEKKGYELKIIGVDQNGVLNLSDFKEFMKVHGKKVALVSIMAANNETGVIQPTKEICSITHEHGALFFSDTTQYIGKTQFNFKASNFDFAVLSSHKVGSIIGSGLTLIKDPRQIKPLIFGGGQEKGMRGGTQNYIGIECLAVALQVFKKEEVELAKVAEARLNFENKIKKEFPDVVIVGEKSPRLPATTLIAYPGIHGQAVQIELESQNIFVSTSSACSDNEPVTSKVLRAMGVTDSVGRGVVRISLGIKNAESNYESLYQGLKLAYNKLRKISSY